MSMTPKKKDIKLMKLGYGWNILKWCHFEVFYEIKHEMKTLHRSSSLWI
jgi:hypothetical protein